MDEELQKKILDTAQKLSSVKGNISTGSFMEAVADKCDCSVYQVIDVLKNAAGPAPILHIVSTGGGEYEVSITDDILNDFEFEENLPKAERVALSGITALSAGIASIAKSLVNDGYTLTEVCDILEEDLTDAFRGSELNANVSIEADEGVIVTSNGNVFTFPS